MDFVKNVCDRALLMRNGKAIFTGLPEEVMAKITEEEEKELLGVELKVLVDGTSLDLKDGATLGDALSQASTKPAVGAIVGIVKGPGREVPADKLLLAQHHKGQDQDRTFGHRSSEDLA